MFKVTYLVFRFGHPDYIPLPVTGENGRVFGHAAFDHKMRAHVHRFTKEEWEGHAQKEGAMMQILKRANRSSGVWFVKAEVEFDAASAAGQIAGDLDAARADIEVLRLEVQEAKGQYDALNADYLTLLSHAVPPPAPAGLESVAPPIDRQPEAVPPEGLGQDTPDLAMARNIARLDLLKFDGPTSLGAEISEQNALGAGIDLVAANTKGRRKKALLAWYESQQPA